MDRRPLIIAVAALAVIVLGAVLVWAIIAAGTPSAAPDPTSAATEPAPEPEDTATATPTPEPTESSEPPAATRPDPVTDLTAKPAPRSVTLRWTTPAGPDLAGIVVVQLAGVTPPATPEQGTVIATLPPTQSDVVDTSSNLKPGTQVSYGVFVNDASGATSTAAGVTAALPPVLVVTPIDVTGSVTQQLADGDLTDTGSLAFTAFDPARTRVAAVLPQGGVLGTMTRVLTEPAGGAPGAVTWTYTVPNAAIRSLAEGAKRDEVFVIELRDGADKVPTTVTVTQLGINDPPTASPVAPQTAIAGEAFAFPVPPGTFADVDATDTLTLTAGTLPGWLGFNGETFTGTPALADVGTLTVQVTATDPHGASATADVVIEVTEPTPIPNQPPVAVDDDVLFDLGVDPLQTTAQLLDNDSDPDRGPNPLVALPSAGVWDVDGEIAGEYTIDADGNLQLTSGVVADGPLQRLAEGEELTATLTYSITDGVDSASASVNITVVGAPAGGAYGVTKALALPDYGKGRGLATPHGVRIG